MSINVISKPLAQTYSTPPHKNYKQNKIIKRNKMKIKASKIVLLSGVERGKRVVKNEINDKNY